MNDGTTLLLCKGEQRKIPTLFRSYLFSKAESWEDVKREVHARDVRVRAHSGEEKECPYCGEVLYPAPTDGKCPYCLAKIFVHEYTDYFIRKDDE